MITCFYACNFAGKVIRHNSPLPLLSWTTILNHDRNDHNTNSMEHWCLVTVPWISCYSVTLSLCQRIHIDASCWDETRNGLLQKLMVHPLPPRRHVIPKMFTHLFLWEFPKYIILFIAEKVKKTWEFPIFKVISALYLGIPNKFTCLLQPFFRVHWEFSFFLLIFAFPIFSDAILSLGNPILLSKKGFVFFRGRGCN